MSVQSSCFSIAARSFTIREMLDNLLIMRPSYSRYSDQESLSKRLRVISALTEIVPSLRRSLILNGDIPRRDAETLQTSQEFLCSAKILVQMAILSDEESTGVLETITRILRDSKLFAVLGPGRHHIVEFYSHMGNSYSASNRTVSPKARAIRSSPALKQLVDFMFSKEYPNFKAVFDLICGILAFGLEKHIQVPSAYNILYDF
ncbi:uncharacterized protein EV420DRAFT_1647172 [Desarmillaria tabescens]|uniref:Uncharacterized protein n=1 Tax=Armillaria tabescens TaxID=1929756 RepID=A0AA39MVT0_ARMTA|nr:uncharacterized protein EV420DRAFT_1647172 [Desarmillaria tabescens]KAK0448891.1 hypothetical protein EV420DRAFT_1647172 [Desarmillaria tabescens]